MDRVPTHNTIDNWVRKCGLDEIRSAPDALKGADYAAVMDECMMIGSQKLLPVFTIPSRHQGRPVRPEDVCIIGLNIRPTWTAATASGALDVNVSAVGHKPEYVITDNDYKMRNAVSSSGYTWHRDISHTLAMFMERVYKNDADFVDFNNKMAKCKKACCMKEVAYLQSPSQRVKARFMNLSDWVSWSTGMLRVYHTLSVQERDAFSFLPEHASFVKEMRNMVSCVRFIEKEMKRHGLSKESIAICGRLVRDSVMCGNGRMLRVGGMILEYLSSEEQLLCENDVLNNSSDIMESMFGVFKYMQSPNKLNGVTAMILHMPVRMKFAANGVSNRYDVKGGLCKIKIKDINQWRDDNLMQNVVAKRIKVLKNAS